MEELLKDYLIQNEKASKNIKIGYVSISGNSVMYRATINKEQIVDEVSLLLLLGFIYKQIKK